jgi:hypothetical protein
MFEQSCPRTNGKKSVEWYENNQVLIKSIKLHNVRSESLSQSTIIIKEVASIE